MSGLTRRDALAHWGMASAAAVSVGFLGLQCREDLQGDVTLHLAEGYGPLVRDKKKRVDLPAGFSYQVISEVGDRMDDGLVVPGSPDGMATFAGPDGLTIVIRNHELNPDSRTGPFGKKNKLFDRVDKTRVYDDGMGQTPGHGGTTTLVYDTRRKKLVRQFLSLAGTHRNCAGGPTPWGTWLTCEETVQRRGRGEKGRDFLAAKDHGWVFEVPARTEPGLTVPRPIRAMGRFYHEAVAIDPASGTVYMTEDRKDGLFYRFLPKTPGKLHEGGRLQALGLQDKGLVDTRNWDRNRVSPRQPLPVRWLDMDDVESPRDDLRNRGYRAGAARFARGEGLWWGDREAYFACTSGGRSQSGQIWRYRPSPQEGTDDEKSEPGQLELFVEPNDSRVVENADNLTVAPWGDVVVCEDRKGKVVRLIGVTPEGKLYTFAHSRLETEFAGVTFSPDGSTLFVNAQGDGLTFAITGPWKTRST